jgi:hypothetical protein
MENERKSRSECWMVAVDASSFQAHIPTCLLRPPTANKRSKAKDWSDNSLFSHLICLSSCLVPPLPRPLPCSSIALHPVALRASESHQRQNKKSKCALLPTPKQARRYRRGDINQQRGDCTQTQSKNHTIRGKNARTTAQICKVEWASANEHVAQEQNNSRVQCQKRLGKSWRKVSRRFLYKEVVKNPRAIEMIPRYIGVCVWWVNERIARYAGNS